MQLESQQIDCTVEGDLVVQLAHPIAVRFRYRSWEAGFGCERWEQDGWYPENSDFALPLLQAAQQLTACEPLARFVQRIPTDIRDAVQPYYYRQAILLRWLARSAAARELFAHSPQLCWLLICHSFDADWSQSEIAAALTRPRAHILQAVTGHGSNALVKALARIQLNKGDSREYHALYHCLARPEQIKPFLCWPTISILALFASRRYPLLQKSHWLKNRLLNTADSYNRLHIEIRPQYRYWEDALNVAQLLDIGDAQIALERCTDFAAVKALHDRWTDRMNQRSYLVFDGKTLFPPPPVAGSQDIFPILSMEDLQEEGRLMHHCVASYAHRVMTGECYIYRMLRPERATIEVLNVSPEPRLTQISLAYNRTPQPHTRLVAQAWLTQGWADDQRAEYEAPHANHSLRA